jgi:hypothetical protein
VRHLPGPIFAVFCLVAHLPSFIHFPKSLLSQERKESETFGDARSKQSYLKAKGMIAYVSMP